MTATSASSAAPPYAVRCWVDNRDLYFEVPSQNGPCVLAYPRNTLGLSKALSILFGLHEVEGHGEVYSRPQLPSSIPDKNGITDKQRQDARDILKKMKII